MVPPTDAGLAFRAVRKSWNESHGEGCVDILVSLPHNTIETDAPNEVIERFILGSLVCSILFQVCVLTVVDMGRHPRWGLRSIRAPPGER